MRHWRRNADLPLRDLERRAAQGDAQALLSLLRAQAQAGQLDTFPEVNVTLAYRYPEGHPAIKPGWGGEVLNEWAGGSNEWEFVSSALQGTQKMLAAGGEPYVISTECEDQTYPEDWGSDLGKDVAWLRATFRWIVRRSVESTYRWRMEQLYREAWHILDRTGMNQGAINESLSYLRDSPEIMVESEAGPKFTARQYAVAAAEWHAAVQAGYLEDLQAGEGP